MYSAVPAFRVVAPAFLANVEVRSSVYGALQAAIVALEDAGFCPETIDALQDWDEQHSAGIGRTALMEDPSTGHLYRLSAALEVTGRDWSKPLTMVLQLKLSFARTSIPMVQLGVRTLSTTWLHRAQVTADASAAMPEEVAALARRMANVYGAGKAADGWSGASVQARLSGEFDRVLTP